MSRILLVDDSPHAQRMGERILADEGYEVVAVSDADSALIRMEDVDPDVILADTVMPGRTGYDICQYVKMNPRLRHVRVILTAGILEPINEEEARRVESDGALKKPFEASALLAAVKPLAEAAAAGRQVAAGAAAPPEIKPKATVPFVAVVDAEQVKAAVTVALDASMESIVAEIAQRVVAALQTRQAETHTPPAELRVEPAAPAEPPSPGPRTETVRRVTPLRMRSGSILGLDLSRPEPEQPPSRSED